MNATTSTTMRPEMRVSKRVTARITGWRRAVLARGLAQVPTSTSNSAPSTAFGSPRARMAVRGLALLLAMTGALGTPAAAQSTPGAPLTRGRVIIETHHTDLAGNIRLSTNEAGTVVRRLDYAPFGEVESVPCGGTAAPSPQFQGKLRDPKTCLDDFGARDYAAATGRFQTVDPVLPVDRALRDPQQWNRYAYARNNPLIYSDPDGRELRDREECLPPCAVPLAPLAPEVIAAAPSVVAVAEAIGQTVIVAVTVAAASPFIQEMVADAKQWMAATGSDLGVQPEVPGGAFPAQPLPRASDGSPAPHPDAGSRAHTQLGTKSGRQGPYPQAREFDETGRPVRDIDFTDHGRRDHTNPHQHRWLNKPTGGTPRRGPHEPLPRTP